VNARARAEDSTADWVSVTELSDLARALLGELRHGRDVIPTHVRDRITALADQWAALGFTAETVRDWSELEPDQAALLTSHGVTPEALRRQPFATSAGATDLWQALETGAISAQEALDRLPRTATTPGPAAPEPASAAPRPAPAVFSHPFVEPEVDDTDRRGRSTPRRTPFQT
jgi:hypothetical protein